MLEIVFDECSAAGLKMAQHYGEGSAPTGDIGVSIKPASPDDPPLSEQQMQEVLRHALETERRRWEKAVPLGGNPGDVLALPGRWDIGPLAGGFDGPARREVLIRLLDTWPQSDPAPEAEKLLEQVRTSLQRILAAGREGEPLRVWVSDLANDACGLRWLMNELYKAESRSEVSLVALPRYDCRPDQEVICEHRGWFEAGPGEWGRFVPQAQAVTPLLCRVLAKEWRRLEAEDAPLRAVVNGQPVSVAADFFDPFLRRALAKLPATFRGGELISQMIVDYPNVSRDGLVWLRMQALIADGTLEQLAEPRPDCPRYDCLLRQTAR